MKANMPIIWRHAPLFAQPRENRLGLVFARKAAIINVPQRKALALSLPVVHGHRTGVVPVHGSAVLESEGLVRNTDERRETGQLVPNVRCHVFTQGQRRAYL